MYLDRPGLAGTGSRSMMKEWPLARDEVGGSS
jgi:hypothetical protein